ncbi:hypothetical protein Trydic_g903 [Trypoxylus dichotomus]
MTRVIVFYGFLLPWQVEEWRKGLSVKAESIRETDGSKTKTGGGGRIWGTRPKISISLSLNQTTTVFQAEIVTALRQSSSNKSTRLRRGEVKVGESAQKVGKSNLRDPNKSHRGLKTGGRVFQIRDGPRSFSLEQANFYIRPTKQGQKVHSNNSGLANRTQQEGYEQLWPKKQYVDSATRKRRRLFTLYDCTVLAGTRFSEIG